MTNRKYKIGHVYRDTGSLNNELDELSRWLRVKNTGGIRKAKFSDRAFSSRLGLPAYLVLVTVRSGGVFHNPWSDVVDYHSGTLIYWGDAKFSKEKSCDDFPGNRELRNLFDRLLDTPRELIPPVLHFTKDARGSMRFSGLLAPERLDLSWFLDDERPVQNYRAHFAVLNCPEIDAGWLRARAAAKSEKELQTEWAPSAWKSFVGGKIDRLQTWRESVRHKAQQLPIKGSAESSLLSDLSSLSPPHFEAATVALLESMPTFVQTVTQTQLVADGGFDFFGKFRLPHPLSYEIDFRGEAKKYADSNPVGPKDVSRLVARLDRRQYGIFVTTSYFTEQAQEEVYGDKYPVHLISGLDLVLMLRELGHASAKSINESWIRMVAERTAPYRVSRK